MSDPVIHAERAVLASLLLDGKLQIPVIRGELEPSFFSHRGHGLIYSAILAVHDSGQGADVITVNARMAQTGTLEEAGGISELAKLLEYATTTANTSSHVAMIRRAAAERKIRKAFASGFETMSQGRTVDWFEASKALADDMRAAERMVAPNSDFSTFMGSVLLLKDLLASDEPMPESLIGERIFCAGTLSTIVGPPKLGKTTLAFQLARSAALGIPWLGFPWDGDPLGVRVGMLQYEMTRGEVKSRCSTLAPGSTNLGLMFEVQAQPMEVEPVLSTPAGVRILEDWIAHNRLRWVFVDSLTHACRLPDKAGRQEVAAALKPITETARRTGCAITIIHHARKRQGEKRETQDEQDVGETSSGSGAFASFTDTYCNVEPTPQKQIKLKFLFRHRAKIETVYARQADGGWFERDEGPQEGKEARVAIVENMLLSHPEGVSLRKISEKLSESGNGVDDRQVRRYLQELKAKQSGARNNAVWHALQYQNRGQEAISGGDF